MERGMLTTAENGVLDHSRTHPNHFIVAFLSPATLESDAV